MAAVLHQRCFHHASREAVVRCPGCRRFFCRECVTEHRGRMMCAACMAAVAAEPEQVRAQAALWTVLAAAGFLLAWLIFYYAGLLLAGVPSDFFQ